MASRVSREASFVRLGLGLASQASRVYLRGVPIHTATGVASRVCSISPRIIVHYHLTAKQQFSHITELRRYRPQTISGIIGHDHIGHKNFISATKNVHIGHRPYRPHPYRPQVGNLWMTFFCYISAQVYVSS